MPNVKVVKRKYRRRRRRKTSKRGNVRKSTNLKPSGKDYNAPYGSDELGGFDRSIYKTNQILNQIDHGFDILGDPIKGLAHLVKSLFV